jgi:glutaryl-CoA dehydrogenase
MALDPTDLFDIRILLSEEERMIQDSVARFTDERVLPIIGDCFDQGRFPDELVPEIAALGLFGSSLPEKYGCAGLNGVSYGLICQELERGDSASAASSRCKARCACTRSTPTAPRSSASATCRDGEGEIIGCFGLTEPQGGSDPANMKTNAKRDGDDWIINGAKMWITNGSIADVAIVWAQTDEGIQGFLIDKGTPGFAAQVIHKKMSLRASVTSALFFDNVRCRTASACRT